MAEPQTVNVGLIVPNTGDLVDTWGSGAVNPDFVAIDGLFAGVQIISLVASPVTLTAPAGFTPTPGGGPTQSQNRVLRLTGTLTADVRITLPLPGSYLVDNQTLGNFVVSIQGVTATQVVGMPPGECVEIYNDGANVRFANLGRMGSREAWDGIIAMPAWVGQCTVKPYLLCDGSVYNFSDYPALGSRLQGAFGGNGITTFAVPDMQGRQSLPYDGTGTRITTAGCGINGQTLGASLDQQTVTLTTAQTQAHQHGVFLTDVGHNHKYTPSLNQNLFGGGGGGAGQVQAANSGTTSTSMTGITIGSSAGVGDDLTSPIGSGQPHNNVQPSIVTGINVIKT